MTLGKFDSEAFYERLVAFGINCHKKVVVRLPKTDYNKIHGNQLDRSSSSPGANYIEALEALGKKDFIYKLRTCRKELRESIHWLRFIKAANEELVDIVNECNILIQEAHELIKIFTSSIITLEKKANS